MRPRSGRLLPGDFLAGQPRKTLSPAKAMFARRSYSTGRSSSSTALVRNPHAYQNKINDTTMHLDTRRPGACMRVRCDSACKQFTANSKHTHGNPRLSEHRRSTHAKNISMLTSAYAIQGERTGTAPVQAHTSHTLSTHLAGCVDTDAGHSCAQRTSTSLHIYRKQHKNIPISECIKPKERAAARHRMGNTPTPASLWHRASDQS
jgi:hypothetical protein